MLDAPRRSEIEMKNKDLKKFPISNPKNQMNPRLVFIRELSFRQDKGQEKPRVMCKGNMEKSRAGNLFSR